MEDNNIDNNIPDIPHGHGLSFKKGIVSVLLNDDCYRNSCHETHNATYQHGVEFGEYLKKLINNKVRR